MALGILGMCAWVHQWYRPNGRLSPEQVAHIFSEMALDGLRAPRAGRDGKPA